MKFTTDDFIDYPLSCNVVQDILEYVKDREFTFEELNEFRPQWVNINRFPQYLKPEKLKPFIEYYSDKFYKQNHNDLSGLIKKLEERISGYKYEENKFKERFQYLINDEENIKVLDKNLFLEKRLEKILTKGNAVTVLEVIFSNSYKSQSYLTTNNALQRALYILTEVAIFKEDEFSEIMKNFNFDYWGINIIESFYSNSILAGNNSAWKSIEKALNKKPFILQGKRIYEGKTFQMFIAERIVINLRCTGWNNEGKIKFVYDTLEKDKSVQKQLSFDLKEFKEYFKDKKFRDL